MTHDLGWLSYFFSGVMTAYLVWVFHFGIKEWLRERKRYGRK